jgi:cell division protein FtsQ
VKLSNGMQVELGRERTSETLRQPAPRRRVAGRHAALGQDIEYADLRYPNGFAIRAAGMRFLTDTDKRKQ